MAERVNIYVDGGNFYHLVLKKIGVREQAFDFEGFARFLAGDRRIAEAGKRMYVGTVREKEGDERSKQAMSRQRSFFSILMRDGWEIKTSKLRKRTEEIVIDERVSGWRRLRELGVHSIIIERQREKGIDVKLATDLIVGAVDDKYDIAIVVSSDSDLVPAIDWIRHRKGKRVEYVGFSIPDPAGKGGSTPLLSMISKTDVQRTLTADDMRRFVRTS